MYALEYLLALFALCFTCVSAAPGGVDVKVRQANTQPGPSGYVIYPPGGTGFESTEGLGSIYIVYQGVQGTLGDYGPYETVGIDLWLETLDGTYVDGIVTGYQGNLPQGNYTIEGYFTTPEECDGGNYRLAFQEHQFIYGEVISFISAQPAITISCYAIQK